MQHGRRITRRPRHRDRGLVDVGGEDDRLRPYLQPRHLLEQQNGDRIGLLAGGAAGGPDAHRVGSFLVLEQLRNDLLRERSERFRVAEKRGDADQEIVEQLDDLLAVGAQALDIIVDVAQLEHLHAALDPAQEGAFLVSREIVTELVAQDLADRLARLGDAVAGVAIVAPAANVERAEALRIFDQLAGHVLDRDLQIDRARGDRAGRHVRIARRGVIGLLRDGQPAFFLDRLGAQRAVMTGAGKDHRDRILAAILGQ